MEETTWLPSARGRKPKLSNPDPAASAAFDGDVEMCTILVPIRDEDGEIIGKSERMVVRELAERKIAEWDAYNAAKKNMSKEEIEELGRPNSAWKGVKIK